MHENEVSKITMIVGRLIRRNKRGKFCRYRTELWSAESERRLDNSFKIGSGDKLFASKK